MSIRTAGRLIVLVLSVISALGIARHSFALQEVRITLLPGAEEPSAGLGERGKPDYRLFVRGQNGWVDCGVKKDTPIGAGLVFPVKERVVWSQAAELRFEEDDVAEDEVFERLPITGATLEGKAFGFELVRTADIQAGLEWFVGTPVGIVLSLGILIGFMLTVLAKAGWMALDA